MKDIDEMDMLGFLKIRSWEARRDVKAKQPIKKKAYIDEVWPGMKPD